MSASPEAEKFDEVMRNHRWAHPYADITPAGFRWNVAPKPDILPQSQS